ncbi:MAG TPA: PAS domain S-box protein [Alphaproteobacteria bacterium]|nr:PAS domain S-box protein [Alphaproteobacteria bacterium]
MFAQSEQVLEFVVVGILVMLFTWIYMRDRQPRTGLWMLGWGAILLHVAAVYVANVLPFPPQLGSWIAISTFEVSGISFLISVSEMYSQRRRRNTFILTAGIPSVLYLTFLSVGVRSLWIYSLFLVVTIVVTVAEGVRHYGKKSLFVWGLALVLVPYGVWTIQQVLRHDLEAGLRYYLSAFLGVTGLLFWRHYRRVTPGIVTTAIAFVGWALVFPTSRILGSTHILTEHHRVVWDIPLYFVAFGMILTLFENQTEVAQSVARRYQELFEGTLAAVYLVTFEGQLLDCNGAYITMYGFDSKQEALNTPLTSAYVDPGERVMLLEKLKRTGQLLDYECRQKRKDGTTFWILGKAAIIADAKGRPIIEGTVIDITERKRAENALSQAEARFATMFRNSPLGYCLVTKDGIFLSANETLATLFGTTPEELIGKSTVDVGIWREQQDRDEYLSRLMRDGSVRNMEIVFRGGDGKQHNGVLFAHLVLQGDAECIFGILVDRTEQVELEAKLLHSQKMEALGRLAGGVAHDFNNLLGVIGGYTELLQVKLRPGDALMKYCDRIIETTQRAGGLTRQLLTFSRKEITQRGFLRPDWAIRDLVAILPRLIGEDIEIKINLQPTGTIVIDKTHFEQIIFNIVVNSRDAMPDGGQLCIQTEDVVRDDDKTPGVTRRFAAIRIRDNGTGMDEQTRLRAFEPFYTTKPKGRGTGLGLATVYGIVQQAGGEISLDSRLGEGTQITILLPVDPDAKAVEEEQTSGEELAGTGNILLVEDETELRRASAEFLTSIGYTVTSASSGPEALELAEAGTPIDVVISDVVMPKMNGREFADRLMLLRPNVKVLFVSGYADDVVLRAGVSQQGTPFLQKPFSFKQLAHQVHLLFSA